MDAYNDVEKNNNICSLDIETYVENNIAVPYAIGYKTKYNTEIFYMDNSLGYSNDEIILICINSMMVPNNHNSFFYVHNLGHFDGVIIIKALMNTRFNHDFEFKIYNDNNGDIVSISIKKKLKNKKIIKITILDSFKMLPMSLNLLCKEFDSNTIKDVFPYKFVTKDNLLYKGIVPAIKFFDNIKFEEYNNYISRFKGKI
jgi:hypothetical protein